MAKYSPRAAKAIGWLKRAYNDVEIFVEDTGNHNMWLNICRRLLRKGVKLSSVNLLGGRDAVLAACKLDQSNDGRRKIYIIDGDYDFLLGIAKPKLKFLYRIRAYCIENLLIREEALVGIGLESCPTLNEVQVAQAIDFSGFIQHVDERLRGLFETYATVFAQARRIRTVRFPVNSLFEPGNKGPEISVSKTRARAVSVLLSASKLTSLTDLRLRKQQVAENGANISIDMAISGKDYLLPILLARFKSVCGYGGGAEQFKVALSRKFDRAADPFFARRLFNL